MSNQRDEGARAQVAGCRAPLVAVPLPVGRAEPLAKVFKVLGDPVRLRLLSMITSADRGVCACDLAAAFDLTQPTISRHPKVLCEAGLVVGEHRGTWVYCSPCLDVLDELSAQLTMPGLVPV